MIITLKELCEKFKISDSTVRRLIKKGLPHYKAGNDYRFDLDEVKEYLRGENKIG